MPIQLQVLNRSLRRLCSRLRWPRRRRTRPRVVVIKKFGKTTSKTEADPQKTGSSASAVHPNAQFHGLNTQRVIRIATFNAASFSMAPAVPYAETSNSSAKFRRSLDSNLRSKSGNDRPKSILKQSPLHPNGVENEEKIAKKPKPRVSINLPDNEISLLRNRQASFCEYEREEEEASSSGKDLNVILRRERGRGKGRPPLRSIVSNSMRCESERENVSNSRTVVEVLRELDADILALQDVKAEEEKEMRPLSDLADALGMKYVFAESWAPEYGNAVLSRWPIKRWKVDKIFDDTDFRNVLKATIDVGGEIGEVNVQCTHLDHLDENLRMKQMNSIIRTTTNNEPHILLGGLNSLDPTDYSQQRWTDILKYYEEMGKPTPEAKVIKFLKSSLQYRDAKEFGGECESVVMIAKGQSVQGTCKYGTRVDYILASPNADYEFVQGSYSVLSSKGTSDHHIVKVDFLIKHPHMKLHSHSHSLSPWKKRWT